MTTSIELIDDFFNTFDLVNNANVQSERKAGEVRDITHVIARIEDGRQPVSNRRPNGHPSDELRVKILDSLRHGDVVDGVVEKRDETSDSNYGQGLTGKRAEDHGSERGGEQSFVDAKVAAGIPGHVQLESERWQQINGEDSNTASYSPIVEAVNSVRIIKW